MKINALKSWHQQQECLKVVYFGGFLVCRDFYEIYDSSFCRRYYFKTKTVQEYLQQPMGLKNGAMKLPRKNKKGNITPGGAEVYNKI